MSGPAIALRRRQLVLEAPAEEPDAAGGVTRRFAAAGLAWCAVEPLSASDAMVAGAAGQTVTHRVTLRWRPGLATGMRWRDGARRLDIATVFDPDERHRSLVCLCREVKP